eukprot:TRINITY_DN3274_c3_g2_i3.p3 TRINITY_DN3274_c3_g2~~TRINITY_DN3274_c3_g2_i3.p3  ORF type:complete len:173 (+),score=3.66 TRINITY_DN3274_c3_g2_i3:100-618(+)
MKWNLLLTSRIYENFKQTLIMMVFNNEGLIFIFKKQHQLLFDYCYSCNQLRVWLGNTNFEFGLFLNATRPIPHKEEVLPGLFLLKCDLPRVGFEYNIIGKQCFCQGFSTVIFFRYAGTYSMNVNIFFRYKGTYLPKFCFVTGKLGIIFFTQIRLSCYHPVQWDGKMQLTLID